MTTCLITGCRLVIPSEEKSLWGDLHLVVGTVPLQDIPYREAAYVFNGVLREGEAAWEHASDSDATEKQIIVTGEYFERRGVVCFLDGVYNTAAKEYIK